MKIALVVFVFVLVVLIMKIRKDRCRSKFESTARLADIWALRLDPLGEEKFGTKVPSKEEAYNMYDDPTVDAWGNEFVITYGSDGKSVTVRSPGRDGILHTKNDIIGYRNPIKSGAIRLTAQ